MLVSCMRVVVTKNNGFWIWRLNLELPYNYNGSSQSMPVYDSLHSLLDYECLPFCVVLIYESATSSASVVRWLTLHS
jgi:hypothetical protein